MQAEEFSYPKESRRLDVIGHLEELRKRIIYSLIAVLAITFAALANGDRILQFATSPLNGLIDKLVFVSPTEAFTAYIKTALLAGLVVSFPFILYQLWSFLSPAFSGKIRRRIALWLTSGLILFYIGISFSYFVAIPTALKFLLGFSKNVAEPMITLGSYISFMCALVLVGGMIFEIPVAIGLLSETGLVDHTTLGKKRPYAYLGIFIFAAIITPTQDIMNMLIFSIPMIILYEIGLVTARLMTSRKS